MFNVKGMKKMVLVLMVALALVMVGCASKSGSMEYIPGKGWVPTN